VPESGRFRLRLMGFPSISTEDGQAITGLGPGKPLALLAYLAVRREARREELVDLLWGEVAEANARNAFRQALHRLRTALGEDLVPPDRDRVTLSASDALWIDRDAFVAELERNDVAAAVGLYRGEFLEGFEVGEPLFDNWADAERVRLRSRFQLALQAGAEAALATGRWLEALQYVQRLSTVAPFEESVALLEANVLVAAGRGDEAHQSLKRFSEVLRSQLDVPPSPRIRDLMARIERSEPRAVTTSAARAKADAPFVGREEEIGRLMGSIRDLTAERGATILIEGPIGIGKSRLVEEVLSRARATGPLLVLRGRERPFAATLPYASIAEALRGALRAPGISGTGRHLLAEAARILPELRDAFELPPAVLIEDEGGRLRFFEGVAALLDGAAYEQPVCVVLDDMHNASQSTLDLVTYLSARLRTSPVLLIVITRSDVDAAAIVNRLRLLANDPARQQETGRIIRVPSLDPSSTFRLVSGIVSTKGVEDQLDLNRIVAAADGNPLRAIDSARRALNGELPSASPTRLRDVLWDRLQKASPSQRRVFFAAALIQRRASLRLLAAASHLPEPATYEAAQALENAELIVENGDGFVVAHDLALAFVSEASGAAGRALLAGWAADALAAEPGATNAELAQLYSIAGQHAAAFNHARRAAYDAAAMSATIEVQRLLGLALTVAPNAKSREEIDGMLAAFGSGRRLLTAPDSVALSDRPQPSADQSSQRTNDEAAREPLLTNAVWQNRRSVRTPRLYWLTGILAAAVGLLVWQRSAMGGLGRRPLVDSLLVVERGKERGPTLSVVTGNLGAGARLGTLEKSTQPSWLQDLRLPWMNPSRSPDGQLVAVERMADSGTDVYLLAGDTINRTPIVTGGGSNVIMGWAPDGASILVRRTRTLVNGGFDADLWAYHVDRGRVTSVPIDTSSARSVREARWSPDGTRIAWVAQTGPNHQQDIFVGHPDGSGLQNLTANPSEDYHISWSSDGSLLAFTSDRRGNPDLFAFEFEGASTRLWSLTDSPYPEDLVTFSPDHGYVAFQSTRDSDAAVYVMPALGGTVTRVTPPGRQYSIVGWRGRAAPSYVDRFRIIGPSSAAVDDSVSLSLLGVDDDGISRLSDSVFVRLLDHDVASLVDQPTEAGTPHRYVLRARKAGNARIIAGIPGWRYDTLVVRFGTAADPALLEDFQHGIDAQRWLALGSPPPLVKQTADGHGALFPNGDLQWQSGLLSRDGFALRSGIDLTATLSAPFSDRPLRAALLDVSLVADTRDDVIDKVAPTFTDYARIAWDGETGRIVYSVGDETKSDPVSAFGSATMHAARISIDANGAVTFFVDGRLRWTSSLRFLGESSEPRARVWLGGRATGMLAAIRDLRVTQRSR
jgi:DNA-binding SARP family transcriptional activator/Tol biopolymer transport system component